MPNNSLFPVSCERVKGCDRHRPIDDLFCCKALHGIDLTTGLFKTGPVHVKSAVTV